MLEFDAAVLCLYVLTEYGEDPKNSQRECHEIFPEVNYNRTWKTKNDVGVHQYND